VPILFFSLLLSKPYGGAPPEGSLVLGLPLIFNVAHWMLTAMGSKMAANIPLSGMYLHPMGIAAWFGMFATALNLIPGGQLDGGHIVFSLRPSWHRSISRFFIAVLLALSWFLWLGWLLWAIVLRITGERHPAVPLHPDVDKKRWWLGAFALLMLVLTFVPSPFPGASGREALRQWKEQWQTPQHQTSPAPSQRAAEGSKQRERVNVHDEVGARNSLLVGEGQHVAQRKVELLPAGGFEDEVITVVALEAHDRRH